MGSNTVNGCGACSGFWKWFKPPHYKFFEKECDLHDILYDIGGNYIDRKIADLKLLNDMLKNVNKYYYKRKILSKVWFLFLCRLYYVGVRIFGFTQFNYER